MSTEDRIEKWVQPALEESALYLVDIKVLPAGKIQVFVDGDENVKIEDCVRISRHLEQHLDGADGIPSNYNLEVSSPGMSNPLKVPRQYKKRIGRILKITRLDGTRVTAKLLDANQSGITACEVVQAPKGKKGKKASEPVEGENFELSYDDIKECVLQFNF